jgi:pimeloyl-ACP methyl ester carboxylesterase
MAQQAAIGQDLIEFMDALGVHAAALGGYDWGGRAACIAALLVPERIRALVTIGGYNVQNTVAPSRPASALHERRYWYQWYFNTERGRLGLEQNRRELCRLLWQEWSPGWHFEDTTYDLTAPSFHNPDFVPVVIHSTATGTATPPAIRASMRSSGASPPVRPSPCRRSSCTAATTVCRGPTRRASWRSSRRDGAVDRGRRGALHAPRAAGHGGGGISGPSRIGYRPCASRSSAPATRS